MAVSRWFTQKKSMVILQSDVIKRLPEVNHHFPMVFPMVFLWLSHENLSFPSESLRSGRVHEPSPASTESPMGLSLHGNPGHQCLGCRCWAWERWDFPMKMGDFPWWCWFTRRYIYIYIAGGWFGIWLLHFSIFRYLGNRIIIPIDSYFSEG